MSSHEDGLYHELNSADIPEDPAFTKTPEKAQSPAPSPKRPAERQASKQNTARLELNLSASLIRKLKHKSQAEGVSLEEFASELIAEGLVLRAWEIMERKSAMRQPNSNQNNRQQRSYRPGGFNNSRRPGSSGAGHSGNQNRRSNNYNNILEDGPNFIEYVRNQEKRQR